MSFQVRLGEVPSTSKRMRANEPAREKFFDIPIQKSGSGSIVAILEHLALELLVGRLEGVS